MGGGWEMLADDIGENRTQRTEGAGAAGFRFARCAAIRVLA